MPYILVTREEDGAVTWQERVSASDFAGEHFRRCLADRLAWAVADAEAADEERVVLAEAVPHPEAERVRSARPIAA